MAEWETPHLEMFKLFCKPYVFLLSAFTFINIFICIYILAACELAYEALFLLSTPIRDCSIRNSNAVYIIQIPFGVVSMRYAFFLLLLSLLIFHRLLNKTQPRFDIFFYIILFRSTYEKCLFSFASLERVYQNQILTKRFIVAHNLWWVAAVPYHSL